MKHSHSLKKQSSTVLSQDIEPLMKEAEEKLIPPKRIFSVMKCPEALK